MPATGFASRVTRAITLTSERRAGAWSLIRAVPWGAALGFAAGADEVAVAAAVAVGTAGNTTARGVGVTAGVGASVGVGAVRGRTGRPAAAPASWSQPRSCCDVLASTV